MYKTSVRLAVTWRWRRRVPVQIKMSPYAAAAAAAAAAAMAHVMGSRKPPGNGQTDIDDGTWMTTRKNRETRRVFLNNNNWYEKKDGERERETSRWVQFRQNTSTVSIGNLDVCEWVSEWRRRRRGRRQRVGFFVIWREEEEEAAAGPGVWEFLGFFQVWIFRVG